MKKLLTICMCLLLCGCNALTNNETDENKKNDIVPPIQEEKKVTIIDEESKTRPYAVMINCHNSSLPQAGLQDAYVVYELMVEGGITRMMALFKDIESAKIGSVRSARTQYIDYVYENDAIYVHAGGATDALRQISNEKISDIDVDGKYGMRDKTLNRAWEHTLFTSSDLLATATTNKSQRTTTDVGTVLKYSAEEIDLSKYSTAIKVNNIDIKYSSYRTSSYKYDIASKNYLRYMNNKANTDLVTNEQYKVKNIIIYGVDYTTYTYDGYTGYQKISNIGTGDGYYVSNGYALPIVWTKSSKTDKTIYTIKETGEELVVNDGNTYIQIYPSNKGDLKLN